MNLISRSRASNYEYTIWMIRNLFPVCIMFFCFFIYNNIKVNHFLYRFIKLLHLISSFLLTRSLLVSYAYVSIESTDYIQLIFEPFIFLHWYIASCAMVLDDWLKPFTCGSHPSISKEHNIWSCIGTEGFWQSGGKELLKVLLTLGMVCLIGDISPTSDVTKVAGFCSSLLMIWSTSSEKQSQTDLSIVQISTPLLR